MTKISCAFSAITIIVVLALSFEVVYDYQAKEDSLVKDECIITSFDSDNQYMKTGTVNSYFYQVYTGDRSYIWVSDYYYVINVDYCIPGMQHDPKFCSSYKDGYYFHSDSERVIDELKVGQNTVCYYEKGDLQKLTVTKEGHLSAQIAGVVILTILSAISLTLTIALWIFSLCA